LSALDQVEAHSAEQLFDASVCVVIPMFNEAQVIAEVVRKLRTTFK
jgi:hypothetical protein